MTAYRGFAKRLVHAVKFDRAKAGAKDIGLGIAKILPLGYKTDVVTYVPTATARVRARGYDQAALIARVVAMEHKLPCYPLLGRTGQARQVGQDRNRRLRQMKRVFYPRGRRVPSSVLLVDDVLTTGATVTAAARALNEMGVKRIDVAVFAVAQSRRL